MILVGLTGSIGMGKTTTAGLFAEAGAPVWSADAAVHRLYAKGGQAVAPVRAAFPGAVVDDAVDRDRLSALLQQAPEGFKTLEAIVHPLVAADRSAFLEQARRSGRPVAVVDVPLLFETGADAMVDVVVTASAPPELQRQRVLARPGMDEARFEALLARQVPDAVKRVRSDFVVDTSGGVEAAREQVAELLDTLSRPGYRPRRPGLDALPEAPQN